MASVKVYPRLDKANVSNQVPIHLRLTDRALINPDDGVICFRLA